MNVVASAAEETFFNGLGASLLAKEEGSLSLLFPDVRACVRARARMCTQVHEQEEFLALFLSLTHTL